MMIQSFGEENEMFAEFTHLSDATRKKIEEFRRRRREAEWYLTECQTPLKKQSKKRSSSIVNDEKKRSSQAVMASQKQSREPSVAASGADVAVQKDSNVEIQKKQLPPLPQPPPSAQPQPLTQPQLPLQTQTQPQTQPPPLQTQPETQKQQKQQQNQEPTPRLFTAAEIAAGQAGGLPDDQLLDNLSDPLNRLKALETRLNKQYQKEKSSNRIGRVDDLPMEATGPSKPLDEGAQRPTSLALSEKPPQPHSAPVTASTPKKPKPGSLRMSVDELVQEKRALDKAVDNATAASVVSAIQEEANRLVNLLLEEAMKGPLRPELVESIKASEAYRTVSLPIFSFFITSYPRTYPRAYQGLTSLPKLLSEHLMGKVDKQSWHPQVVPIFRLPTGVFEVLS